ncbi:helix-turn-helix domain-containing protein [Amphritea pacifica]|uniref:Helix-turn-helix transcriptional regulator n=1 Tax=Amphritea pacifica TaxID=2811233 RepID=A0ABS2W7Q6_9GAMM|nr:helix-turn-helix transcriptional regulator [Amphritea pacifica]MBN0987613.1 helix-turn-helix transcriptional regulator [Amphritea pacifica]MBN1007458.1 helix-turn-helix transcriptional regulator [Amphritea pacifica]
MHSSRDIWPDIAEQVAGCIDRLGSGEFYPRFFQMMKALAQIDQYMVFEFSPNGEYATCRLAHNVEHPDLGLELASLYLDGAYLDDPMLQELKASVLCQTDVAPYRLLEKRQLPPVYRRRFFNVPHFDTKFSFIVLDRKSQHLFYVNFYSKKEDGFADGQLDSLKQVSSLIGSLLLKHFRDERKQRGVIKSLLVSGLSEREAQICDMILQGHTAKSTGNELGLSESTIITYKKRAFKKLKICRKSELVRFV